MLHNGIVACLCKNRDPYQTTMASSRTTSLRKQIKGGKNRCKRDGGYIKENTGDILQEQLTLVEQVVHLYQFCLELLHTFLSGFIQTVHIPLPAFLYNSENICGIIGSYSNTWEVLILQLVLYPSHSKRYSIWLILVTVYLQFISIKHCLQLWFVYHVIMVYLSCHNDYTVGRNKVCFCRYCRFAANSWYLQSLQVVNFWVQTLQVCSQKQGASHKCSLCPNSHKFQYWREWITSI